jgi:hypothetical protein
MTLKDQSFVNKLNVSFVCLPEDLVTFKFWEMLKNASEVTLLPKNIFFLKIVNFGQSFVECKLSLADGTSLYYNTAVLSTISPLFDKKRGPPTPRERFSLSLIYPSVTFSL